MDGSFTVKRFLSGWLEQFLSRLSATADSDFDPSPGSGGRSGGGGDIEMQKIWTTVVTQLKYVDFEGNFGQIQTLESWNFILHQFAIHGRSVEKEKQLDKTAVFRQLVFFNQSCEKERDRVSFQILYPTIYSNIF